MTTLMPTTIAYGPTYAAELAAIVGMPVNLFNPALRQVDNCLHTGGGTMQEYRTWLNTETGRVFKVIDNGISYSKVLEFENVEAYRAYDQARRQMERDPETGRQK